MFAITPVMYKGGPAGLTDVMANNVDTYFAGVSVAAPHMGRGDLKLLAVTGDTRAAEIPDVPTLAESGFPGFKVLLWTGLLAPAGTAPDIVARIAGEIRRMVNDPMIADRLTRNGIDLVGSTPQQFSAMITEDMAFWSDAVKAAGLRDK